MPSYKALELSFETAARGLSRPQKRPRASQLPTSVNTSFLKNAQKQSPLGKGRAIALVKPLSKSAGEVRFASTTTFYGKNKMPVIQGIAYPSASQTTVSFLLIHIHAQMPRKKVYKDIHLRLSLADLLEIEKLSRLKGWSKTDLIREALAVYFAHVKTELRAPEVDQVTRQVRHLESEVLEMMTLCWQAAAESMFVSLECYKQVSPEELSQEQLDQIKADAKKFSQEWSKKLKEISLIDNAQLKHSPARRKQIELELPGIPKKKN